MSKPPNTPSSTPDTRNPLTLATLDWVALAMLALVLLLTATGVGEFPTTLRMSFLPPNGPLGALGDLALPLSLFLTVVAFLLVAWREWRRPVAIGGIPYLTAAMIFLGGWGVLSLWHTHSLFHSLNALTVLLSVLMFGGLIARLARDSRGFIVLLLSLIASASIVGALGIREYLEFWNLGVVEHRTFGPFANPDFLAGYLLLTLPITLAAFASVRERMAQLALGIGLALQSGCLMLTASRAGLGVLLVAFLVWLALSTVSRAAEGRWKTIGMGFLVIVVSMVLASAPTRSRVVGAPGRKVGNGTASSAIQEATASQSHSGEFRRWTWIGTYQMMTANPILGTGIGTFPIAYPHYATTAFTAHAHNGYLQLMGELGVPGLLLFLTALAAATAFATHTLLLGRQEAQDRVSGVGYRVSEEETSEKSESGSQKSPQNGGLGGEKTKVPPELGARGRKVGGDTRHPTPDTRFWASPRLLLAGLLAAIVASMLHSLADSDWYIVATAFALSATGALLVALGREITPLATQTPRSMPMGVLAGGLLVGVFLLWRAEATGMARLNVDSGATALMSRQPEAAISAYRDAVAADPFDPEARLDLAKVYEMLQRKDEAERELKGAILAAPIGKTFYRLGQFLARKGDLKPAITVFEQAREREPKNLQNLRALAETLRQNGETDRAAEVYRIMTHLEEAPYGQVRAVPEIKEIEFAFAHVGLAEIATEKHDEATVAKEYEGAYLVLHEYWPTRNFENSQMTTAEKKQKLADMYGNVLTQRLERWKSQGAENSPEAVKLAAEFQKFQEQRAADTEAENAARLRSAP